MHPTKRCGRCLTNPSPIQRTLFAYDYDGAIVELIQQFKFNEALILSKLLGDMIINRLKNSDICLPDALIPVPLYVDRLKQRGFNQSLELAKHIGKALDIPVYKFLLIRTRATPKQSGLDRRAREKNIRGAFKLHTEANNTKLTGKHLAIVDDVVTTGSTTREAARILQRISPALISVVTIAKTRTGMKAEKNIAKGDKQEEQRQGPSYLHSSRQPCPTAAQRAALSLELTSEDYSALRQ